jgi:two-component system, OmpR family, phosphate regulon sensor histidine kinase PhoR
MRPTIRWKLLGSHLLVALVMGGVIYGYLTRTMEKYLVEETTVGLVGTARLARLMATREIREIRRDAPAAAAAIARETKARVTFISPSGEVLGDSDVKPGELRDLENHLDRPEVQQALKSGQGSAIRHSATLRTPMLYVAFPFQPADGAGGILRLALPLSALQQTRTTLHAALGVSLVVALLVSLLLSYILSNVTSRSLRTMAKIAARFGAGEFGRRIPVTSRDEVGELARVMNEMAIRIEGELSRVAAEKNRLDAILRGMGEGVMVTGATGVVTLVNPAFRALFDLQEEVEGKPLLAITRHPALNDAFRMVVGTRNERIEEITFSRQGDRTVLTHWVPLLEKEEIRGVVAVFHDISDLKRMEKVRRDFVANVSHELRTPVAVIQGYAETLLAGGLATDPDRAPLFLEKIHSHAQRLASLIGDLLALSALESGEPVLAAVPLDLARAVERVCALLDAKARAKGITIDPSALKGVPPVLADQGKLEQVLVNLLDNAVKYTPEHGTITVAATGQDGMVAVTVADTGIGIPSRDLPRIFERFYRVDQARSREEGGTGLGLAIVKHIVQLHGGSITVTSTPGRGSTFTFTLRKAGIQAEG